MNALIFSVYATTDASSDSRIHKTNDELLQKVFLVAAQFGNIPIVISGDFQANPASYPSVAGAIQVHGWLDPLCETNEGGCLTRPYTYSKDCSFSAADEGCTSIDGVLVNNTAFCAAKDIQVLPHFGRQHRPIQVLFDWPVVEKFGFVHLKFAPLDVSGLHSGSPSFGLRTKVRRLRRINGRLLISISSRFSFKMGLSGARGKGFEPTLLSSSPNASAPHS